MHKHSRSIARTTNGRMDPRIRLAGAEKAYGHAQIVVVYGREWSDSAKQAERSENLPKVNNTSLLLSLRTMLNWKTG